MTVSSNLAVQCHQQDTDYYCGAACAQMVLQEIGAGLLDQDDLYADNHSHSTIEPGWYTAPDGLQWTLNDRRPASFSNYFALFALNTEEQISRKICWTIHHYNVAPVALVYGSGHWIVLRGYTASAHPSSSADTSYAIDAFDVNNPWPPTPSFYTPASAPPPPHSASDGCGSGGNRGVANEHITYATWQSTYMTGVPGGYWNGKFVAVCDPEPPAERGGRRRPPTERRGEGALLAPQAAGELALSGLRAYGLHERKDWQHVLERARPGPGVMVQRLDRLDSFYSLVPFQVDQRAALLAAIDGRWGDYLQSVLVPEGGKPFQMLGREEALSRVVGRRMQLAEPFGRLVVRKEALCLYPFLVWRPCRESQSPWYPFHMFTIGGHRLYVRIDGEIFSSLTTDQKGL